MPARSAVFFTLASLLLIFLFAPSKVYAVCTIPANPTCWTGDSRCTAGQEACNGTNESGGACVACRSTSVTEKLTCSAPLDPNTGEGCNNICGQPGATSDCYTQVFSCGAGTDCTGISGDGCNYCVAPVCSGGCGTPGCPACPTPTPTPLPAPTLSGGFPGGAACSSNGTTLSYSWNSITGAVRYAIRIDDRANGWNDTTPLPGDTIDNNITSTSYSRSSTPGATYDAWIHTVDSRGVYSDSSNHSIFTCPVPATLPPGVTPTTAPTFTCTDSNGTTGYCGTASKNFDPSAIPPCSSSSLVVSNGTCPSGSIYSTCYICTATASCTSCGTGGICGGSPATAGNFPAACPSCPSNSWGWYNSGADDATCASSAQGSLYPHCWVCSVPVATATPVPPGVLPTPVLLSGCFNPPKTSGSACGPEIDSDGNPDNGIQGANYGQRYPCGTACINSNCNYNQYCSITNRDENGNPISGAWTSCTGSCPVAPTAPPTSTVSGLVFIDRDADGRKDADEVGYFGEARLFLNTQNTTTDTNGTYQFTGVTSGSYTLELDVPFGFSPNKSTGWDGSTNKLTFSIPPAVTSADFGIVPYEVGVGGTLYTTLDGTCSTSITTAGRLGSKSLSLSDNYFGQTFTTATDINGVYSFSAPNQTLFPGSYAITPSDVTGMRLICAVIDGSTYETIRSTPYTYGDNPPGENLTLTAQNPQKRVDFYYQLIQPWFQGQGADMRIDAGFRDPVSASSRDPYAMLSNSSQSPGVIFSGGNRYSFCTAGAGTCLERASELANPWIAGGTIYPEAFTPAMPGTTRTSYSYLLGLVKQNGQTINEITNSDCYDPNRGCNLADLDPGVYTNQAGQNNVYTRASKSQFNRGDYAFLINGNLHIQGELESVNNENASALVVSVSGDITVDKTVGGSPSSFSTHLEGFFSADSDFVLESEGTEGNNCPSNRDRRLNIKGAVVANAVLSGGTFQNKRTLCDDNSDYPVFYLEESPYLILNAPDYIKHKSFVWQEVAP